MKVNHIEDLDTHVTIGGNNIQSFGMADTAEFFTILSNTLYSDKKLAVIREVLCNAWDAHIEAGKTDTAVKITLSDNKLIIRDFGAGISHENIVPIYCIYGASTKASNNSVTGGFGLGSKAPFAYSDHFTVTSCHDRQKTVYAISRGGTETEGKPEMRTILRIPTTETGLEVSIPIKNDSDIHEFQEIIKRITLFGDMKVQLNDHELPTLEFNKLQGNIALVPKPVSLGSHRFYVRYGSVIYPIPEHDDYKQERKDLHLGYAHYSNDSNQIWVFQAEPGTISVTPSRESLSMNEQTRKSLVKLFTEAHNIIKGDITKEFQSLLDYIFDPVNKVPRKNLLTSNPRSLLQTKCFGFIKEQAKFTEEDIRKYYLVFKNGGVPNNSWEIYLNHLKKYDPNNKGIYQKMIPYKKNKFGPMKTFYKEIQKKLYKTLESDTRLVQVAENNYSSLEIRSIKSSLGYSYDFIDPTTIIVAHSRMGIKHACSEENVGSKVFCMNLPRKKGVAEEIIQKLKDAKYNVLDYTHYKTTVSSPSEPRQKTPEGFIKLSDLLSPKGTFRVDQLKDESYTRINEAKIIFEEQRSQDKYTPIHLSGFNVRSNFEHVTALVPDAVVVNTRKFNSLMKKGVDPMGNPVQEGVAFLVQEIDRISDTHEEFYQILQKEHPYVWSDLARIADIDPDIAKEMGYTPVTDTKIISAVSVFHLIDGSSIYSKDFRTVKTKVFDKLDSFRQSCTKIQEYEDNLFLKLINLEMAKAIVESKTPQDLEYQKTRDLILAAMKG